MVGGTQFQYPRAEYPNCGLRALKKTIAKGSKMVYMIRLKEFRNETEAEKMNAARNNRPPKPHPTPNPQPTPKPEKQITNISVR